jgi:CO/xanthine dehydrogenase Mo-binding subunit
MTGLLPENGSSLHEKEFSRKSFVKTGGALVVGFSLFGSALAGKASAANGLTPFNKRGPADFLPDLTSIDAWITITADNKCIVTHGETELGHGTPTGILMLTAEELNMSMDQMSYAHPETWLNATGGGAGSGGISARSTNIRAAAALAKQTLLGMASTQLGVGVGSLTVDKGVISGGGKTVTYGALVGGKLFNTNLTAANSGSPSASPFGLIPGQGISKPPSQYTVVGKSFPRIDIPAKVMGTYTYVQNVHIPGMLHGRVVQPRGAGANTSVNDQPVSVDPQSIAHIPGAQVVQVGNWIAVVAPKEYDAIQAASQLKVVWKSDPKLPGSGNFWGWLRKAGDTNTDNPARYTTDTGNVTPVLNSAAKTVSATYKYHYNGFMPIGPHCAVADVRLKDNLATVYVQAQAINGLPANLAGVINGLTGGNMPAANVRVIWYEGASSFGGGQTGEVNEQAVILSTKLGVPVRVQWMRWDQHGWDHYGMANLWDVKMGADAKGNIIASDWVSYGQAQSNIDQTKLRMGTATWPATPASGGLAPMDTLYSFVAAGTGQKRVLAKTQPLYGGAFKCNFLRAPSAPQQFFASEQIIDELAHAVNMDPIAFRRQNIDGTTTVGARWLAVLDGATLAAGWKPKVAASNLGTGNIVNGRGFGFGIFANSQVGIVADVQVNKKSGKMVAKHLYISQNNGITIGPQLVANQMSGAAIQGLSRAMLEQNQFTKERITSTDWVTYPILRFADAPAVTLVNVHPGEYVTVNPDFSTGAADINVTKGNTNAFNNGWVLTGSGEPPTAAIAGAMANAFFDATGARVRQSPMNSVNCRNALKQAGIS